MSLTPPDGAADPVALNAARAPDAVALVEMFSDRRATYAQLDARVGRAAGWLKETLGDPAGQRVAWLGRNSLDQAAMVFACFRAGAIFQPLNWRLPGAELRFLIEDAAPGVLVYDAEFEEAALEAASAAPGAILIRRDAGGFADMIAQASPAQAAEVDPHAPFILLYTSGSTGRPKGAVITRAGAAWSSYNFLSMAGVDETSGVLCDAPMFHTVGLMAVTHAGISAGARVLISDRFAAGNTLKWLSDPTLGVTHYFAVPQISLSLREHPDFPASDLSGLKAILSGGAPMPPELIRAFLDDGVIIANGYGMTEVGSAMCMPFDAAMVRGKIESCGLPAPAMEVRIVRPDGTDAGVDEPGEVWMKGPSVTPGYWNRPEANAEVLTGGWFRSGDIGVVDSGGFYRIVDRLKDMYISGGENVYPAEVEAVLAEIPGVAGAAVVGCHDPRWGETGCAFVQLEEGAELDEAAIKSACNGRLARYKIPAQVRFMDNLPRTGSGKVLKNELRKLL